MFWWRADYAEALLEMGKADEAAALVDAWEAEAQRLDRSAVLAEMTRCRGLVAAARGDLDDALAELERAVAQHEVVGDLFGRARALLALGTVRRRARQKRAAREAITAAVEGFEACGAVGWAERARGELGTIGGRTRIEGLTPAEGRIAALVAEGRTNREVAAPCFSPSTRWPPPSLASTGSSASARARSSRGWRKRRTPIWQRPEVSPFRARSVVGMLLS